MDAPGWVRGGLRVVRYCSSIDVDWWEVLVTVCTVCSCSVLLDSLVDRTGRMGPRSVVVWCGMAWYVHCFETGLEG